MSANSDKNTTEEIEDGKRFLISSFIPNKKVLFGVLSVGFFYFIAITAQFFAPYDYRQQSRTEPFAPPTTIRWRDTDGNFHLRPFIYRRNLTDPLERTYSEDTSQAYPISFFARGHSYKILGLITSDRHFFGVEITDDTNTPRINLLGTDELGRDRFSRLLIGSRFTLIVGPLGTLLAASFGVLLGCLAVYSNKFLSAFIMRTADTMMALPTLVLVLATRAAFPLELPPLRAAGLLILIFVAFGWAEMTRLTESLVRSIRQREFVTAAVCIGLTQPRILWRHILPNAFPTLLAQVMIQLPAFILVETALSFLGVGLQEPEVSWGTMLASATDITQLHKHFVLLLSPAIALVLLVSGFRLLAKGLQTFEERQS